MSDQTYHLKPLITSQAFTNQQKYLPIDSIYTIQGIEQMKKYLPKHIFKFVGIENVGQSITQIQREKLQKLKLKIHVKQNKDGNSASNINYADKNDVQIVQWENKYISLKIPFNSKDSDDKVSNLILIHLTNFFCSCMLLKNKKNSKIYKQNELQNILLTVEQIKNDLDLAFTQYEPQAQSNETSLKLINIHIPVMICLNSTQTYTLKNIRNLLITDLLQSVQTMIKNNLNSRVLVSNDSPIYLNSYCNGQNFQKEEKKLLTILSNNFLTAGPKKTSNGTTKITSNVTTKNNQYLMIILLVILIFYAAIKFTSAEAQDKLSLPDNINSINQTDVLSQEQCDDCARQNSNGL